MLPVPSLPYNPAMFTFIELAPFAAVRDKYLDDDQFGELQTFLAEHPDAGDVIPGSDGCRKLRWSAPGRGKRGGARVIYFLRLSAETIVLVTLYGKNVRDNIEPGVLKSLREKFDHG